MQRDERAKLRGQRLAELTVTTASSERSQALGRERTRIRGMRGIALRRAYELFREHPSRAESTFAKRKRDFIVNVAQELAGPLDGRRPAEAIAWPQVVQRKHDDRLAGEAGERAVRQRRDLRIRIGAPRAGSDQCQARYEGEASHECPVRSPEANYGMEGTAETQGLTSYVGRRKLPPP